MAVLNDVIQDRPDRRHHQRVLAGRAGEERATASWLRVVAVLPHTAVDPGHHLGAAPKSADREATSQRLSIRDQISADAEVFLSSAWCNAEASDDFVKHQHNPTRRAQLAQLQQLNTSVKAEATSAVNHLVRQRDQALGSARDAKTRAEMIAEQTRHEVDALRSATDGELQRARSEKQRAESKAAALADELEDAQDLASSLVKSENAKMSRIDELTNELYQKDQLVQKLREAVRVLWGCFESIRSFSTDGREVLESLDGLLKPGGGGEEAATPQKSADR